MELDVGVVSNASGSAFLKTEGGVSVLCSVRGPYTVQRGMVEGVGSLDGSVHYAPFTGEDLMSSATDANGDSSVKGSNQMTGLEKHIAQMLKDALVRSIRLDLYPKMVISLSVLILQSSGVVGTDLAAAITCGSLALVDASIETIDFVTASAVGKSNNSFIPSPSLTSNVTGSVTIATLASLNEVSHVFCEGRIEPEALPTLVTAASQTAQGLRPGLKEFIKKRFLTYR
jgi:ribonuclease PH